MVEDDPDDGRTGGPVLPDRELDFGELTADFYRGEIDRAVNWRGRLDQTTNWAVVVVAAILTWAFSSGENPHYVILLGVFAVTAFLFMEANRYREYDVWRNRIRILQEEMYAEMYLSASAGTDWERELGEDLQDPTFNITFREALSHRLRRSYLALLLILLAAWLARVTVFVSDQNWRETASIYFLPGELVVGLVGTFYVAVVIFAAWSARESRIREFEE